MKDISEIHKSVESAVRTIYDIVKEDGGELKAERKRGEGTEFSIYLPA